MSPKPYRLFAGIVLLLNSSVALAMPFSFLDPRSMGMGGAGVAVADAAAAPLFNPALLSITRYSDDFSLTLPTLGARVADPDDLIGSIDKFQSGNYVDNLQTSITALNDAITAGVIGPINTAAGSASTNISSLSAQLATLNNKPITFDAGAATVVGIPNKRFGIAFYANAAVATGGIFQYRDAATLATLSTQASCLAAAADAGQVAACGTPSFTTDTLQSAVTMRGVMLAETGFALSREYRINKQNIALGITPKIMQAQLYDVPIGINSPSLSNFNGNDYRAQYSLLNFDIGMAKNHRNGWRSGLVIKNVVPAFLAFKRAPVAGETPVATGETLRLMPQSRIGVSYTNRWSAVALDVDLYRNDPAGLENYTQYIALGGELNGWNWGQLRAGYRVDLVNSSRNIASLGLGFSPFGVHADLAVAGNAHELGAAFQLGFRF
ncbi:MAG: hypothetical protein B7Y56_12875 [Gallionellales bacterium 35-53-114]|jgi:hypothetical protein|nr:MAG: hypothetical protein B7Y56_12875 [Gallionellales bacterium 35-53-114]OYZ63495.1 MAG: hypothetical protein B7Y04_09085 [Gallionellales bacterium 24-53-125]OZB10893.1 MAG: hypothetical protein B7X61_00605 [Gallionellales bacterium 39-52-133]HQS58927.1 conjugal transfer protein TraF [Gallionellaceae bacterium]HQS75688.1 conjugal transfer protein TraF [Gallionellaceae bacterium]